MMWIRRIVDMTAPPGGIRNGSAMYSPVTLRMTMHVAVTQCVTRTGICQT